MEAGSVTNELVGFGEPIPHSVLPYKGPQYKGQNLLIPQLDMSCFFDNHGRLAPF